jgi:hypothetical protein
MPDLRLRGNDVTLFDIIITTKSAFLNFQLWGVGRGGGCNPAALPLGAPLARSLTKGNYIRQMMETPVTAVRVLPTLTF